MPLNTVGHILSLLAVSLFLLAQIFPCQRNEMARPDLDGPVKGLTLRVGGTPDSPKHPISTLYLNKTTVLGWGSSIDRSLGSVPQSKGSDKFKVILHYITRLKPGWDTWLCMIRVAWLKKEKGKKAWLGRMYRADFWNHSTQESEIGRSWIKRSTWATIAKFCL